MSDAVFPSGFVRTVLGDRDPVLERVLRTSLGEHEQPTIQVDDNAGRLLGLLVRLTRPRRVLEIGTLFGYSTIFMARALPEGARIVTLERDADVADLARRNLAEAGLDDRVDVVVGDALEHLAHHDGALYDLVFVDGQKTQYPAYLAAVHPLLAPGGVLVTDDAFASGDFAAEDPGDADAAAAISAYVRALGRSSSYTSAFAGTETGLMISIKEER